MLHFLRPALRWVFPNSAVPSASSVVNGLPLHGFNGVEDLFRRKREFVEAGAGGVVDGVAEDGGGAVDADFGNALGAERTGVFEGRHDDGLDGRDVAHGEDVVVGEGGVGHAAVLEQVLLGEGVADAVEGAAFGLAFAEGRVDGGAAVARGAVLVPLPLAAPAAP